MKTIPIEIGALAKPISVQLAASKISKQFLKRCDQSATALVRLYVQRLLTDAEFTRASKRLIQRIQAFAESSNH